MGLGQAHLDGVLLISKTEALLRFQSTPKMMTMMHLLGVAMAWHDEPIRLHIHPPTNTHLRDYVAVRGRHPSGTQTPTPGREVVSQSPPSNPHPQKRPLPQFCMALRDLGVAQIRQLMEDLQQEAAHRELTASPIDPPLGHWRPPAGGINTNVDNEEVTLQVVRHGYPVSCCHSPQPP